MMMELYTTAWSVEPGRPVCPNFSVQLPISEMIPCSRIRSQSCTQAEERRIGLPQDPRFAVTKDYWFLEFAVSEHSTMLWLLGAMAAVESLVALLLVSKVSPLVQLGQKVVEGLRSSRSGAAVVKTLSGAMLVLLASDLSSVLRIRKRMEKTGATHVDQFAMQSQLLEMTLIGEWVCFADGNHGRVVVWGDAFEEARVLLLFGGLGCVRMCEQLLLFRNWSH